MTYRTGIGPVNVAVADFNSDDVPDLAVANFEGSSVSILLGIGDGTFDRELAFSTGAFAETVATGDFDGDGYLDLAIAHTGTLADAGGVSVLMGRGQVTCAGVRVLRPTSPAGPCGRADLNADGKLDLVLANGSHLL